MLNKCRWFAWIKHGATMLIAIVLVVLLYWHWLDVSLIRRIPNISEFAGAMYDSGNQWIVDYLIHLEEKLQAFLVIAVLFLISNFTFKYKRRNIVSIKQKVMVAVMVTLIVADLVISLFIGIACYIIIIPVCWYLLLQTLFEPIPMFKKKSALSISNV